MMSPSLLTPSWPGLHLYTRENDLTMDGIKDKRFFERADIKWPATLISSSAQVVGETKNISEIGVYILCQELPLLGEEYRLEIKPPNRKPLKATAKVVWITTTGSEGVSPPFGVGAKFENITENDINFLCAVIANEQKEEN